MRIGPLLAFMLVTGAAFLALAAATGSSLPLYGIWAAYGLAIPIAARAERPPDENAG